MVKRSQEQPRTAKRSQAQPSAAKRSQAQPSAAKCSQAQPSAAKRSQTFIQQRPAKPSYVDLHMLIEYPFPNLLCDQEGTEHLCVTPEVCTAENLAPSEHLSIDAAWSVSTTRGRHRSVTTCAFSRHVPACICRAPSYRWHPACFYHQRPPAECHCLCFYPLLPSMDLQNAFPQMPPGLSLPPEAATGVSLPALLAAISQHAPVISLIRVSL